MSAKGLNKLLEGWEVIVVVLAFIVLYLAYRDFGELRGIILSPWLKYQETTGVILSSDEISKAVGMGQMRNFAEIIYQFSVGGTEYQSDQVNYAGDMYRVDHYLNEYQVGEQVIVYYDVKNPGISVLEPKNIRIQAIGWLLVTAVCLFLYLIYLIVELVIKGKQNEH